MAHVRLVIHHRVCKVRRNPQFVIWLPEEEWIIVPPSWDGETSVPSSNIDARRKKDPVKQRGQVVLVFLFLETCSAV
jgi:hypothetical protein